MNVEKGRKHSSGSTQTKTKRLSYFEANKSIVILKLGNFINRFLLFTQYTGDALLKVDNTRVLKDD